MRFGRYLDGTGLNWTVRWNGGTHFSSPDRTYCRLFHPSGARCRRELRHGRSQDTSFSAAEITSYKATYPHDAQLDYFRLTPPKALHPDSILEQLHLVSRFRINSVQCRSRSFDEAHHRTALEFRLRRRVCPKLFWLIDCDVVPDDTRTIMLSHRVGEHSVSVPVLLDPLIVNAPKSDGRGRAQVTGQHGLPNYERAQMRV